MAGDAARILNPIELTGPRLAGQEDLLTPAALAFLIDLHRAFEPERQARLAARRQRQARFDAGELPDFRADTRAIREGDRRPCSTAASRSPARSTRRWSSTP
jgi:malate synthase